MGLTSRIWSADWLSYDPAMDATGVIAAIGAAGSLISIGTVLVQTGRIIQRVEVLERQFNHQDARLDQLEARHGARLDQLEAKLVGRFDRVEDKLDRHLEYHLPRS